jgi:hypothetical protein
MFDLCCRRALRTRRIAGLVVFAVAMATLVAAAGGGAVHAAVGPCGEPPTGAPTAGAAGGFVPITPTRVLDTRIGLGGTTGPVGTGCVVRVPLATLAPSDAIGVAATLTVTDAEGVGFATAYPCGSPRPFVSNVNTRADSPVPNLVLAPLDVTRELCVFTSLVANLIVDVTGWFTANGGQFHDVEPVRALDTRTDSELVDADTVVTLSLDALVPPYATAIAVNLTITQTQAPGYATAFPCGSPPPIASNVNFIAGEDRAAQAIVGLGNRSLCVYLSAAAHVIVDVWGWLGGGDGARLVPAAATRLADSRTGAGGWSTPLAAGETRALEIGQQPGGTHSVVLDVVAVDAEGAGYLTIYACGAQPPPTSSINYSGAGAVMNLVTAPLGSGGQVCVYSSAQTHVVIDLFGYTDNPGPLRELAVTPRSLTSTFVAAGRDYAVMCAAGTNHLTVTAVPVPGHSVTIGGASSTDRLTTDVDVSPNQLVQIDIRQGATVVDHYYIRCLPPDFPAMHAIPRGVTTPGWYLVTPATFSPVEHYAVIVDERGVPLWYRKATTAILDFKRLSATQVAWVPVLGTAFGLDPTRGYEIRDLNGAVTREVKTFGLPTDHHDLVPIPGLPNGNFALFGYELVPNVDLTALGAGFGANETVAQGRIQEIDQNGALVREWKAEDHIDLSEITYPVRFNINGTSVVDLQHFNALDIAPNGDYIVTARHMDSVFRVSRATGNVMWKLGGTASKDGAPVLQPVDDPLGGPKRPHDGRLLPDGSISLFDNRLDSPGATRGVVYAINPVANTATLTRSLARTDGVTVGTMGSTRVTSDGHLIVGWGANAPLATELDDHNAVVLDLQGPEGGSYRAIKEPVGAFDRATLRASPSG